MGKLLITGGAGYIGSHTVYAALDAGHDVAVLDDLSTGVRENLPESVPFFKGDVGDGALVDTILAGQGFDGVLHFAGSIVTLESVADPVKYYRNNTMASLSLIASCLRHGVKQFIFSSSAAVYGMSKGGLVTESTPLLPINPYGWSKLFTEQMLRDVAKSHGLIGGILRYFNVAGADQAGRTGETASGGTHLIKAACEVAVGKRAQLSLFGTDYDTPDGTCIRDFIHVSDLAEAHIAVFAHMAASGHGLCLNCGNGRGYSVREVIAALEEVLGHSIAVREAPRRAGDPPVLIADASKITKEIGWRARRPDIRCMIESALAWERRAV